MQFSNIVCLLNIVSPWRSKADGFFDFIREPIKQACGIDIGYAPGKMPSKLRPSFYLAHFRSLAQKGCDAESSDLLLATLHHMPESALDYLFAHLPDNALILSSEIPPWLRKACEDRQLAFLDIRMSPLGFGRDSFIAMDTNHATLRSHLAQCAISEEELRLEAGLLSANLRIHRGQLEESMRHTFNLDGALLYIWQPSWDLSLLQPDGHTLHISDFATPLKALAQGRKLLFMRDFTSPHIGDLLEKERSTLSALLEQPVQFCPQNIYQVLTGHDDSELVSINAGAHQEAPYFHKKSHTFAPSVTPLAPSPKTAGYLQVHFQDILAPAFWHQILTPDAPPPRLPRLPTLDRQHARESMNEWGEYEKVLTWERFLPWQAFRRLGGLVVAKRLEALETRVMALTSQPGESVPSDMADNMASRIRALKNTKVGETAYIFGNGPSINELNIDKLMELDSFWCNNAYKMEEKGFKFSPKYYFFYDPFGIQKNADKIFNIDSDIKFFSTETAKLFQIMNPDGGKNFIELNVTIDLQEAKDKKNFSIDPSLYIYNGASSVILMLQFAFYMGYSKILIGGVDLDYNQPYFYDEFNPLKDSRGAISENTKNDILLLKSFFEKNNVFLGKITKSPNLPLEYIECSEISNN